MKKKYLLLSFFMVALLATVNVTTVNSKISSPPAGNCGDPFTNQTCVQNGCHGGALQTIGPNDLTLTIGTGTPTTTLNSGFSYAPGTQYNIGFLINAFTGRYGFQIVSLNASNTQAGTMTVSNAATTKINTSGGTGSRQYMGHLNANSTKNWVFKWTSPAAGTGAVTFYYAYATEDGNGDPGSNVIYKGNVSINEAPNGIADISTKISSLNIFPNPVSNEVGFSFDLLEADNVSAQIFSLDGKLSKQLLNENMQEGNCNRNFNVAELAAGIYLLQLNVGQSTITRKIVKQ